MRWDKALACKCKEKILECYGQNKNEKVSVADPDPGLFDLRIRDGKKIRILDPQKVSRSTCPRAW
jgi:hypothetical protein